jgi:hypothetical protein
MQIAMEGRDAAKNWEERARNLNDQTENTLKDVSNLLKSVRNFSEGTLVDEIFDLGTNVVTTTTKLMAGMNKIYDVISGLLGFFTNLFNSASENTRNTNSTMGV